MSPSLIVLLCANAVPIFGVLKTAADLRAHRAERRKFAPPAPQVIQTLATAGP